MEISLLPKGGVKIKGKQVTLIAGTTVSDSSANALLLFTHDESVETVIDDVLVIDAPGDFEVSGVKISALRNANDIIHTMSIDGLDVLVGKIGAAEKMQSKLGENQIVILYADTPTDASFAASITTNVLVLFGEHGKTASEKVGKGAVQEVGKYSVTMDKLPIEVETILLS